jgi:hypothetical protein
MQNSRKEDIFSSHPFGDIRIGGCEEKRKGKLESNCDRGYALFVGFVTVYTRCAFIVMSDWLAVRAPDMQIFNVKMAANLDTRKRTAGLKVDNSDRE